MPSSSLMVFATTDELARWLQELQRQWSLGALVFDEQGDEGHLVLPATKLTLSDAAQSVFLFPADRAPSTPLRVNDIKPRPWGWITARFGGGVVRGDSGPRLLLSDIQAEDFEDEPVHPARFLRWLKKQLKARREVTFGVAAEDVPQRVYRDIGYTAGAESLRQHGVAWAQFKTSRSVFHPVRG